MAKELEKLYDNPFDDQTLEEMKDDKFDDEVNNLIEWCEDLDYEKYTENWHEIATSNKAEVVQNINQQNPYKITTTGLGEYEFQPNQQIMALQQEYGGSDMSIDGQAPQVTQAMIDQNIAQIQLEQQMAQYQHQQQQMQALNQQQQPVQQEYYKL